MPDLFSIGNRRSDISMQMIKDSFSTVLFRFVLVVAFVAISFPVSVSHAGRPGELHLTDGTVYKGKISSRNKFRLVTWAEEAMGIESEAERASLRAADGDGVIIRLYGRERYFDLDMVRSIRFEPRPDLPSRQLHAERMERRWDWEDRGSGMEKVYQGEPFPVRELQAVVTFNTGEIMFGSLRRCAFYVFPEGSFTAERFIVRSRERGEEGENLDDLVHVEQINFFDEGRPAHASRKIRFKNPKPDDLESVWAVTRETFSRVDVKPISGSSDTVEVTGTFGEEIFLAAKVDGTYYAGWRDRADEKLYKAAERHLKDIRDYYNERKLLGVYDVEGSRDVLTLVSLRHHAYGEEYRDEKGWLEQFRLAVWRWRYDEDSGVMVLISRGSFLRKRLYESGPTPPARGTPVLWIGEEQAQEEHVIVDGKIEAD